MLESYEGEGPYPAWDAIKHKLGGVNMYAIKYFADVRHVWDIFSNSWVTEEWWDWVHARTEGDPPVRTYDPES